MKSKPSIWVLAGMGVGTFAGLVLDNVPAGITLGTAMGILTMLVSFTTVEKKK